MWGAAGFGTATLIGGIVYDHTADGYGGVVVVFVAALSLALVAALGVQVGASDEIPVHQKSERSWYVRVQLRWAGLHVCVACETIII